MTRDELYAITDAVGEVLGGTPMRRAELGEAVGRQRGRPELAELLSIGWGVLLKPAAARGLLCFGPRDGQSVTFVSPRA